MKSSFFQHFYDLTGPKYAEKYEDSESGLKSIHFLTKATKKHNFRVDMVRTFLGKPFLGHWWSLVGRRGFLDGLLGSLGGWVASGFVCKLLAFDRFYPP